MTSRSFSKDYEIDMIITVIIVMINILQINTIIFTMIKFPQINAVIFENKFVHNIRNNRSGVTNKYEDNFVFYMLYEFMIRVYFMTILFDTNFIFYVMEPIDFNINMRSHSTQTIAVFEAIFELDSNSVLEHPKCNQHSKYDMANSTSEIYVVSKLTDYERPTDAFDSTRAPPPEVRAVRRRPTCEVPGDQAEAD